MSAAANSSSTYQRLTESDSMLVDENMGISVISRIDYNLRFAKQAVLVVGKDADQYSQLASKFLVSLSNVKPTESHLGASGNPINVALISASSKLNDIQIRCRLIEQLFVNSLFDPEQSLAVSVLRFATQHGEDISIVIDHAHALSLQVKYELCQLVNLAKKSKLTINVVLFGLTEAAQQLTVNKNLFKDKIAVIDAGSGQVISLDDKSIMLNKVTNPILLWQKVSLAGGMLLVAVSLVWVYLLIVEDVNQQAFNFSDKTVQDMSNKNIQSQITLAESVVDSSVIQLQKKHKTERLDSSFKVNKPILSVQATSEEINKVLMMSNLVKPIKKIPANVGDVLNALAIVNDEPDKYVADVITEGVVYQNETTEMGNYYYQTAAKEFENGYVVQIAGFSDEELFKRFLSLYPDEHFYSYQRQLNGKSFTVITSKVFQNKAEAKDRIQWLPSQLIDRKPWVKSISSVINEINTFTR